MLALAYALKPKGREALNFQVYLKEIATLIYYMYMTRTCTKEKHTYKRTQQLTWCSNFFASRSQVSVHEHRSACLAPNPYHYSLSLKLAA